MTDSWSRQIHRRDAAVDEQIGAVDERRILARQEQHRFGGLQRLARALGHVRHWSRGIELVLADREPILFGTIAFTLILWGASCAAMARVKFATPPLAAE